MKQQKHVFKTKHSIRSRISLLSTLICCIIVLSNSCKSDLEKVAAYSTELDLPELSAKEFEFEYTDTGRLQFKFITPLLNRYANAEDPYYEFPEGIEIHFYDENEALKSVITSNYSIYKEKPQLWEARDSVVARNVQTDEKIETEQMFWDQPKKLIYSKVFTKITNEDGVYYGEKGFEAAQDFSYYRLKGSSGTVRVQDEEQ